MPKGKFEREKSLSSGISSHDRAIVKVDLGRMKMEICMDLRIEDLHRWASIDSVKRYSCHATGHSECLKLWNYFELMLIHHIEDPHVRKSLSTYLGKNGIVPRTLDAAGDACMHLGLTTPSPLLVHPTMRSTTSPVGRQSTTSA